MNLRKLGLILACLVMLTGIGTVAHASDVDQGAQPLGKMQTILKSNHFGKDWGFALGVKTWASEWSLPVELPTTVEFVNSNSNFNFNIKNYNIVQFESDTEMAFIPTFMVRYRNFFVGGSYFPETEYDFSGQSWGFTILDSSTTSPFGVGVNTTIKPSGERKEWDLSCGYFFNQNFAVSLGYKKLDRSYVDTVTINLSSLGLPNYEDDLTISQSINAPIVGLAASVPIGKKFSFSGNLAYGWLNGDADGNYYLAELGLNYIIPIKKVVSGITINAGYRFQRLEIDSFVGDQNDSTSGFIFGANVHF